MAKTPSFAKRVVGKVEPALQHNGFAITFLFTYIIINIVFFVNGATIGYRFGQHEPYVEFDILARGAGAVLSFNSALVIFVASKSLMTYLRRTALNMIVPFDKAMPAMHTIIGNVLVLATVVHVVFQGANYVVNNLWFNQQDRVGVFGYRSVAITGILLLVVIGAMRVTSLAWVRKRKYEAFFWIHNAGFVLYFALLLVHGVHYGVPMTYRYVGVPLVIYVIDRVFRFSREKGRKVTVSREFLVQKPGGMVNLRLPRTFSYLAGQYCDIRIPSVSKYEWHPFTIASSPHESEMLFFIKDNGDWTHKLFELAGTPGEDGDTIDIHIRGPYGAPAQHVGQYEHVVLVSGGVGATPFASITKYAHHWILNYTPRGNAATTSVSAAFTRNQSTHHSSMPGTPTQFGGVGRRSVDISVRRSVDNGSRNISRSMSRNLSRNNSRSLSRNVSRNVSRTMSRTASRPNSRPLSRSTSATRFDRMGSVDSLGVIIQEQRLNQPHGPVRNDSLGNIIMEQREHQPHGPTGAAAAPPGMSLDLALATDPPQRGDRSVELDRYFGSSPQPPTRTSLPEDYKVALGDPDAPIPDRRSLTPGTAGAAASSTDMLLPPRAEIVREYDSSKALFDDDEDDDDIATFKRASAAGLETDVEFGELDLEMGGIQLEDEILRENQTASNAYNMLGMSFGSAGLLRHFQKHENVPLRSSMMRASLNIMDNALDAAPWQDRFMFYLHTVTLNWMLLWIMILRFALVAVAEFFGRITEQNRGFDIYNSVPFAIVDLVLACILIVPVACAIATELGTRGVKAFFGDEVGNFFDLFLLLPLLIASIVLTSMISFTARDVTGIKPITVFLIWPVTALLLLWRTGRTIGSRISLAQYFKSTHAQTKSLDFIWVAKTQEEDHWLIDQLLPLAGSGIVRLHRFITRSSPTTEPWMLDFEKLPLKTTYKRPDWDEVFGNLVERSRSGTVVGVFFCGPDPMARAIQQAAMKAMACSVENSLQRGYVAKKRAAHDAMQSMDDEPGNGFARSRSDRSGGGGVLSRVGSKVGELARTLSSRKGMRGAPSPMPDDPKDQSAYGCNVRISVRIENFN